MTQKELIRIAASVELSRRSFWYFCCTMIPAVYNNKRPYLKRLCNDLQKFWETDDKRYLCLSIPPRHCKTLTITLFVNWVLGRDRNTKIMTGSYNEDYASDLSKTIRNRIMEVKADEYKTVFSDVFDCKIQKGSSQAKKFKIEGANTISVLSTSMNGSATGMGCNLLILDDMIKSAQDSYSIKQKDKIWDWFLNTMLSRLEGTKQKVILIGTRWCKDDLIGRIIASDESSCHVINIPALDKDGNMLCEDILTRANFEELKSKMSEEVFMANYQGIPIDLKDRMYTQFNTYKAGTKKDGRMIAYIDTADTGQDYLCCLIASVINGDIYLQDIYYTKDTMEVTEEIVAKKLLEYEVVNCRIEGNNGGRGFARNVGRITEELGNKTTKITTFTQSKNKNTRIFSNRRNIENNVYYPDDWDRRYPEFFKSVVEYKATAENEHDDAEDALTGMYETVEGMGYYNN